MFGFFKKRPANEEGGTKPVVKMQEFTDVRPLIEFFKKETGIDFDKKQDVVKNKFAGFCRNMNIDNFGECLLCVQNNADVRQDLINYLTVNETYFYREMAQIEVLARLLKERREKVSILCAPSSTGAEPYTIAIVLLESGVPPERFHITGIDINSEAVERSRIALYNERTLHRVPPQIKDKYFVCQGKEYLLVDKIKTLAEFTQMNVFDSAFRQMGKFDFIFSRNMLIYFDDETKLKAKGILEKMLKGPESRIFFGHADMPHLTKKA